MLILFGVLIFLLQLEPLRCTPLEDALLAAGSSENEDVPCFSYDAKHEKPSAEDLYLSFTEAIDADMHDPCGNFYHYACSNYDKKYHAATATRRTKQLKEIVYQQKKELFLDRTRLTVARTTGSVQTMVKLRDLCLQDPKQNEETCFKTIDDLFRLVMDHLYLQKYWVTKPEEEKKYIKNMVDNIMESLREMLNKNKYWMDLDKQMLRPRKTWTGIDPKTNKKVSDTTFEHAIRKLDNMNQIIGSYPEMLNCRVIDVLYAHYSIDPKADYAKALMDIKIQKMNSRSIQFGDHKLSQDYVQMTSPMARVTDVNAQYMEDLNCIFINAAILQRPFFDIDYPDAVNYGRIGQIIGHEITHGFDSDGSKKDVNCENKPWMGELAFKEFEKRDLAVQKLYESPFALPYHMKNVKDRIQGKQTSAENIADQGGLRVAHHAFLNLKERRNIQMPLLEDLKIKDDDPRREQDKLFFTSYATAYCDARSHISNKQVLEEYVKGTDPHSPGYARVNVVLGNNEDFTETYQCYHKYHERMVPEKQTTVWSYTKM